MLKAIASQVKALHLQDFRGASKRVRGDLMRRACDAERRKSAMFAAVGAAAVGAVVMYFFDPGIGESRRSWARERLTHWYLSGRGQLDHGWRQLQSESPSFHLTENGGSGDDRLDAPRSTLPDEAAELPH